MSPQTTDLLLAVGLTLFAWLQVAVTRIGIGFSSTAFSHLPHPSEGFGGGEVYLTLILLAVCLLPLALRRRYPIPVLIVTVLGQVAVSAWTHDPILSLAGPLLAIYTVGTVLERRKLLILAITVGIVLSLSNLYSPMRLVGATVAGVFSDDGAVAIGSADPRPHDENAPGPVPRVAMDILAASRGKGFATVLQTLAFVGVAAALGNSLKTRREYVEEVERRAEEAERTREEMAMRRIDEERLRIARELHDITAHSLSSVAVQAGAAQRLVETNPALARKTVEQIRVTSKAALEELRSIVGVLRTAGDTGAPLVPEAGLSRLPEIVHTLESAGLAVALTTAPGVSEVPLYADVAAYRIVQEASTNILRHAKEAKVVRIALSVADDGLVIDVSDDGAQSGATADEMGGGHGIAGMRERAVALGGTLQAGPRTDTVSGFAVHAWLPLSRGGVS